MMDMAAIIARLERLASPTALRHLAVSPEGCKELSADLNTLIGYVRGLEIGVRVMAQPDEPA